MFGANRNLGKSAFKLTQNALLVDVPSRGMSANQKLSRNGLLGGVRSGWPEVGGEDNLRNTMDCINCSAKPF
jgi:hypothetical protein